MPREFGRENGGLVESNSVLCLIRSCNVDSLKEWVASPENENKRVWPEAYYEAITDRLAKGTLSNKLLLRLLYYRERLSDNFGLRTGHFPRRDEFYHSLSLEQAKLIWRHRKKIDIHDEVEFLWQVFETTRSPEILGIIRAKYVWTIPDNLQDKTS